MEYFKLFKLLFRFPLGTRRDVDKYIKQFTEIFTEEGRRAVKITHQVIGQKPTVTYTQPLPSTTQAQPPPASPANTAISNAQARDIITQATNLAASFANDGKKGPPLKLSLQINPNPATVTSSAPGSASTPGTVML